MDDLKWELETATVLVNKLFRPLKTAHTKISVDLCNLITLSHT